MLSGSLASKSRLTVTGHAMPKPLVAGSGAPMLVKTASGGNGPSLAIADLDIAAPIDNNVSTQAIRPVIESFPSRCIQV
jgi:hypothetical protein